jgi:hypothetical protein
MKPTDSTAMQALNKIGYSLKNLKDSIQNNNQSNE